MALLVTLKGPSVGRQYPLDPYTTTLGRHIDSTIVLESQAVSRQHARIIAEEEDYYVEDLNSSNGTYVNGRKISDRTALTEQDTLQVGPYYFGLRRAPVPTTSEEDLVIRDSVHADASSLSLDGQDAAHKLQVVLEIARQLARTLDVEALLRKFLEHVMQLFPQADRGMILLCEGNRFVVRAYQSRQPDRQSSSPYSRTIVKRALDDGIGILSEDVRADNRFQSSFTITNLDMRSLLCVPLISSDARRLGVVQLDRFRAGGMFQKADLQLLTAVGLQVALVLENVALHAEILREERLRQEVAFAREIQESFLPTNFPRAEQGGFELFARVRPAREVSGDFYDFFPLGEPAEPPGGQGGTARMAFFVGDVSGKGMPAALFMAAVRVLGRHLAAPGESPSAMLGKLNTALAADNPAGMFVTLVHGIYDGSSGEVVIASAGHPLPLLRQAGGRVDNVNMTTGRLLGYENGGLNLMDARLTLAPGETLIVYTDGVTEPHGPDGRTMFGLTRLQEVLGGDSGKLSLEACADHVAAEVERFTGKSELQDDLTLFLLRRVGVGEPGA